MDPNQRLQRIALVDMSEPLSEPASVFPLSYGLVDEYRHQQHNQQDV